ncbi:STAS domain-containing protein [Microvirga subterranea]|uniref:Anti-sigma factor antagonist n=1 Tax=Microvirga subterranea TaxID=186651 RepID=A0A370HVQ1_9HYPH|nr:STAS domain-containing protein [Microvirga subterranea]RDI62031.1 anti-sigma B factor antagonist [Microvirga subterranea]
MLTSELRNNVLVVHVGEKRVDASKAPLFKDEMTKCIESGQNQLVLDLSGVDFVDSSGLGAIVSCLKRLGPRGNLAIAGAKGAVSRLFTLTRMDKVFTLHDSVDAAVAQLSA